MSPKLAIVIPAYKHQFLRETLESIAQQTCKNFNLYIGDDGSPNPIGEIIEEFRGKLDFVYKRFEENLGAKSLVGHWNRCIGMTQGEEWLMVLGDDDLVGNNFVENFYGRKNVIEKKWVTLVRYSSKMIDEKGLIIKEFLHPVWENATDAFYRRMKNKTQSSLSQYIFKREVFEKYQFKEFPLAWHSDDLAWLEFTDFGKIYSINESYAFIRKSDVSITFLKNNIEEKEISSYLFFKTLVLNYLDKFLPFQKKDIILRFEFIVFTQKRFTYLNWKTLSLCFLNSFGISRTLKFNYRFITSKTHKITFNYF